MTHDAPSWPSPGITTLVFPEAGGAAALSAFSLLRPTIEKYQLQLIAIDRDLSALAFWHAAGAMVIEEAHADALLKGMTGLDVIPCDENFRAARPQLPCSLTQTASGVYNKAKAYDRLAAASPKHFKLPARLPKAVIRPVRGAGSKGLKITTPDELVTEYIPHDGAEFVVDFNNRDMLVGPRLTHALKHGADTFVSLLGSQHGCFELLADATFEAAEILGITGVGNVQWIAHEKTNELYFVEASPRLSGSAWVNVFAGINLLTGAYDDSHFDIKRLHTHAGGIFI